MGLRSRDGAEIQRWGWDPEMGLRSRDGAGIQRWG